MRQRFALLFGLFLFVAGLFLAPQLKAQTSASATVVGTVTDQSNAAIPNATITLKDVATGISQTATANASGQYTFPTVTPGTYTVQVTKQGFKNSAVQNLVVEVAKSYTVNVAMQVGEVSQSVTVEASSNVQLETNTAQVSGVITGQEMSALPTLNHDAQELINIQPSVQPGNGTFPTPMARISGAIDDQNTITLDGIDISDNLVGNGSWIPTSLDSVQEFDVGITNPNATFGRSSGGQIALYGKHGTNQYHGTAYWYAQNSALNANSWDLNTAGVAQPHLEDNRGGVAFGGPIIKNKTFIFANYELDRFPQSDTFTKTVPTANLKAGILTFADAAGNIDTYNLKTAACAGGPCDPRGLGISPKVQAFWNLLPGGNFGGVGDGLNTTGFRGTASAPLQTDNGVLRLDHNFNDRWRFSGSYDYFRSIQTGNGTQFDVLNPADPIALGGVFLRAELASGQLTTQITPNLTNTFRFGWVRNWQNTPVVTPEQSAAEFAGLSKNAVTGTASGVTSDPFIAINPAEGQVSSPIENASANARFQDYFEKSIQFSDSIDWVKGKHSMEFGTDDRHLPLLTDRADKVVNGITSLVTVMDSNDAGAGATGSFLAIPAADEPVLCATATSTNCLPAAQAGIWNQLYAGSLGLIDNTSILAVRNGSLNPLPFGTPLSNNTTQNQFYFYGQDVWRLTNSLTVSYGLSYGWQTAPSDTLGRQTILIDATTGQPLSAPSYISQKMSDAEQGTFFNPTQGYVPVNSAGKPVFNTDWGDVAPRVSVAWNPSASDGFLGRFLGDRKTVIRGGYSMVYDRESTIETVVIPMLGVGFGQTISSITPNCAGATCTGSNPASSDFRVGVDGNIPVPSVPPATNPDVPSLPFGELLSFQDDPNFKVGRTNAFDLDIQRELPHSMLLEVGYIGHRASRLPSSMDIDAAPYMFKDTASGQTFAQAFDSVDHSLEAGTTPSTQPFFENQLPGFAAAQTTGTGAPACPGLTNTACLVALNSTAFTTGSVGNLFQTMDLFRLGKSLPTYDNLEALLSELRTYIGTSTYNGLIVSLQKKTSAGLTFGVNYTLSKSLDQGLVNQDNAGFYLNSYNVNASYGPSIYDRRNVFNADYVYQLPLGNGHRVHFSNGFDRALSGWYWSGIFTAYSGLPDVIGESSEVWGGSNVLGGNVAAVPTVPSSQLNAGVHSGVIGSNGVGIATNPNPPKGSPFPPGTGLNIFADPFTAFNDVRNVNISTDGRDGDANPFRGLGLWNYDMTVGKSTAIRESVRLDFTAQFLNVFNHVNFQTPGLASSNAGLSLGSPSNFGEIVNQFVPTNRTNGARWIELGLRLNF